MKTSVPKNENYPVFTLPSDDLFYDDDNRLSNWNSQSAVFDDDGNMTNGPLPNGSVGGYSYDSRNRLTSAGGSGYRYNPDGLRVEITGSGSATFVIDPNAALSRTLMRTKNGTTTYYVYGLGLLYEETSNAPKYYHFNQVGSTLALTDGSQNITDRVGYSPFGTVTERTGTTDIQFLFNGEMGVMTDESGLLHMRARYYNPRLMRFCNADPIGFGGGLNHYAFCENDPISFADPFGLCRDGVLQLDPFEVIANWSDSFRARAEAYARERQEWLRQRMSEFVKGAVHAGANLAPIGDRNQEFLAGWLLGELPSTIIYDPNSPEMLDMMNSPGAAVMREDFYRSGTRSVSRYGTWEAFWGTVIKGKWSSTALQVGGFYGATVHNNGNGTATFTITNVAGFRSFTGSNVVGLTSDRASSTGPMHNVTQTFTWTEPIKSP